MAVLVDIDLDDGTLDEFDATQTDSGDLSVTVAAALAGTVEGLNVFIDGTGSIYGQTDFTWSTRFLRWRIYLDPNALTMASGDAFRWLNFVGSNGAVWLEYNGTNYRTRLSYQTDGSSPSMAYAVIPDDEEYIEFEIIRATTDSASDGSARFWIGGVLADEDTGLDIFDVNRPTGFRIGAVSAIDAGTSGTFYIDQIIINDDGGEIGEESAGSVGASAGTSTATGVGRSKFFAVGSSAGVGAATAVGKSTHKGVGAAAGVATATGDGRSKFFAVGSSAGVATATAVGLTNLSVGSSAGTSAVAGVGRSTAKAVGASAGAGSALAVGMAKHSAIAAATGTSTAAAVGMAKFYGVGVSAGVATAAATGRSTAKGVGSSAGLAVALAVGLTPDVSLDDGGIIISHGATVPVSIREASRAPISGRQRRR